jgi:hypothetical protein
MYRGFPWKLLKEKDLRAPSNVLGLAERDAAFKTWFEKAENATKLWKWFSEKILKVQEVEEEEGPASEDDVLEHIEKKLWIPMLNETLQFLNRCLSEVRQARLRTDEGREYRKKLRSLTVDESRHSTTLYSLSLQKTYNEFSWVRFMLRVYDNGHPNAVVRLLMDGTTPFPITEPDAVGIVYERPDLPDIGPLSSMDDRLREWCGTLLWKLLTEYDTGLTFVLKRDDYYESWFDLYKERRITSMSGTQGYIFQLFTQRSWGVKTQYRDSAVMQYEYRPFFSANAMIKRYLDDDDSDKQSYEDDENAMDTDAVFPEDENSYYVIDVTG